jgi:hypothetical protein
MYRFLETERYEGKSILTNGVTQCSLKALKHLPKVGKLISVRGYVYASKRDFDNQPITRIGVTVKGENGYIRFGGFLWGYGGEGPRGLMQLFAKLGIVGVDVATLCGGSPDYSASSIGEWWRITFEDGDVSKYSLQVKRQPPPANYLRVAS